MNGKDRHAVVQQQGLLSVRDAVDCILQAAEGLQYAHDKGELTATAAGSDACRPPPSEQAAAESRSLHD